MPERPDAATAAARWQRLEALFVRAAELPPAERDAFVARETEGDPALARELAGMLAWQTAGPARIAAAIGETARVAAESAPWIGRRFGPYRVIREIGRGGMGLVFEAVRDDDQYRKTVALKIAPFWRGDAAALARFRSERQILAELEHPHIARFLDGGTEDEVPFFVMEYVDGLPITEYCDRHRVDLRGRLALMRQVCAAVQFAHQSLVVHRDLKPANILVADDGAPRLVDFGIAKLLDPIGDSGVTAAPDARWTPDYASPEQVRGRAVTTRTDVYSLGLVLYELLTGARAQQADTTSPVALDRSICEAVPPLPSARLTASDRGRAQALAGDLDTIVMTAIRKEPERRYESAAAFADDIGRYLDGRPILARPSTVRYRTGKFIRRHRAAVAASVVVAVSLAAGFGAALIEARRAERRFQQVRTLANTFVFDVNDQLERLPGSTDARRTLVQTALVYLESLRQDAGRDPALARELAAGYWRVGNALGVPLKPNLGDSAGALDAFAHAEALLDPLVRRGDGAAARQLVAMLMNRMEIYQAQGKIDAARKDVARAEAIAEPLLAGAPRDTDLMTDMIDLYTLSARMATQQARLDLAEAEARRSVDLSARVRALVPDNHAYGDVLASANNALGQVLESRYQLDAAREQFAASVAIREQLVADEPANPDYRRNLMISYGNLADVLGGQAGTNLGDLAGAEAALQKASALAEWSRRNDPNDRRARYDVATVRLRLGSLLNRQPSRVEEAVTALRAASVEADSLRREDPSSIRYRQLAVTIWFDLAKALQATGHTADAMRLWTEIHDTAPTLGPLATARNQSVVSGMRLAALSAAADHGHAVALADSARRELARKPLTSDYVDAAARSELARLYAQLADAAAPVDRAALQQAAATARQDAVQRWRAANLAPAYEAERRQQIAALETPPAPGR